MRTGQISLRVLLSSRFRVIWPYFFGICGVACVDRNFPGLVFRRVSIENEAIKVKCTDIEP